MKKLFVVMACLAFAGALQAQSLLTKGNPYATNVRTGNRPGAGDWGLYIGPSYAEVMDLVNCLGNFNLAPSTTDLTIRGLPLVNLKYYASDNLEFRGGIQYYKRSQKASGTEIFVPTTDLKEYKYKESEWFFRLIPGFAYHFSPRNVLDVYAGASLPLGFEGNTQVKDYPTWTTGLTLDGEAKDAYYRKSLCVGLEAFIGLQAFVADLPLSIGLEYGLSGMFHGGEKYKHVYKDATGVEQTTYDPNMTIPSEGLGTFTELKANSGVFGSDFRFTITYYFNNK